MKVEIYSRKAIKELMDKGFPQNVAVISFYTPNNKWEGMQSPVDYSGFCNNVFHVGIPDIDIEILADYGYTYESYLAQADELAQFIYEEKQTGSILSANATTVKAVLLPAPLPFCNTLKGAG